MKYPLESEGWLELYQHHDPLMIGGRYAARFLTIDRDLQNSFVHVKSRPAGYVLPPHDAGMSVKTLHI